MIIRLMNKCGVRKIYAKNENIKSYSFYGWLFICLNLMAIIIYNAKKHVIGIWITTKGKVRTFILWLSNNSDTIIKYVDILINILDVSEYFFSSLGFVDIAAYIEISKYILEIMKLGVMHINDAKILYVYNYERHCLLRNKS